MTTKEQEQQALDECRSLAQHAAALTDVKTCAICGNKAFFYAWERALVPGHIYSENGVEEFRSISGCCEYCFDKMFATEEADEIWDEATKTAVGPIHGAV